MKRHRDRQPGKRTGPLTQGSARSEAASAADSRQPDQPTTIPAPLRASLAGSSRSATWLRGLLLGLLLVGGTIIAYHPVWHAGFVFDDDIHIRQNRMLFDPDGLKQIWTSLESPQYYPMVFTSFRLEQALWGLSPSGYHWINLLLHAASVVLVWRVLRRLGLPGAWLAAAIFAVHPVNVESVAWISERKNALSMPFYLLSLLLYLMFDDQSEVQSPKSKVQSPKSGVWSRGSGVRTKNHGSRITHHALFPPHFSIGCP